MFDSLPQPKKSPNDKREYRYIELDNRLRCLLVSDPETEKSAACMNITVGALEDPWERQGLAHFLEHMLFLGSEKYREALDIFSAFFIAPLFTESCVEREVNAVNSEHERNLTNDANRVSRILKLACKKGNPYFKFSCGNLKTLLHSGLREALLEFYKKYYSSNLMNLAVYSNQNLDAIEKFVREKFSSIKNLNIPAPKYLEVPFDETNFTGVWKVTPLKEKDELAIKWLLPEYEKHYRAHPLKYFSHIIGHEGENSLRSFLVDEGLASGLTASYSTNLNLFCFFSVSVILTKKGLANYKDVIAYVFQYLELLKTQPIKESVFEELKKMSHLRFAFQDKTAPQATVCQLAEVLPKYPVEDLLQLGYLYEDYNEKLLKETIQRFQLDNMRILLIAKEFEKECTLVEEFYGTKYTFEQLPLDITELYSNPGKIQPKFTKKKLDYPPENTFIPTDFTLKNTGKVNQPKYPEKILETAYSECWFKMDDQFNVPKASITVQIFTNDNEFGTDLRAYLLASFWLNLLYESLSELLYLAKEASAHASISQLIYSFRFTVKGFNDALGNLVTAIFKQTLNFDIESYGHLFPTVYKQFHKSFINEKKDQPSSQVRGFLGELVHTNGLLSISTDTKLEILESIKFEDVVKFSKDFFKTIRLKWLIVGNYTQKEAENMISNVEELLEERGKNSRPLLKQYVPEDRIVELPKNSDYFYNQELPIVEKSETADLNSAILMYYQNDFEDLQKLLLFSLLANYLREPCFTQLRTNEQLGYVVHSQTQEIRRITGYSIIIQSNVKPSFYLRQRIFAFLDSMREKIKKLTDEEFKTYQNSVLASLKQKDFSLYEESTRYSSEIIRNSLMFDRREKSIDEIMLLKKEQLIALFEELFYTGRRLIEVHLTSQQHKDENKTLEEKTLKNEKSLTKITSPQWFKKQVGLYPDYGSYCESKI